MWTSKFIWYGALASSQPSTGLRDPIRQESCWSTRRSAPKMKVQVTIKVGRRKSAGIARGRYSLFFTRAWPSPILPSESLSPPGDHYFTNFRKIVP